MAETIGEFVAGLRELRVRDGATSYRVLEKRTGIPRATLHDALRGDRLPALEITLKIVRACGGEEAPWRERWCAAYHATTPEQPPAGTPEIMPATSWWKRRRLIIVVVAAGVLAVAGTMLVVHAVSAPRCTQVREYTVTQNGNMLDGDQNYIDEVKAGDVIRVRNLNTGNSPNRYSGTDLRTGKTGYVVIGKLHYTRSLCV